MIALNPVKVHFYSEFGGINSSINHHAQNNFNSNVIAIITTFSKIPWKYRQTGGRRYDGIRKEGTIQTFVLWFEIFLVWILSLSVWITGATQADNIFIFVILRGIKHLHLSNNISVKPLPQFF